MLCWQRSPTRPGVVFLANPNNPTGSHLPRPEFERLLSGLPERVILVVDEAYHEFAMAADGVDYPSSPDYRSERSLLVTLRTFSKIYGLAGLRVGYGISTPAIIDYMNRIRRPFNVTTVAQAAAVAALDDWQHVERSNRSAREGIPLIIDAVTRLGLTAYSSLGNFVLIDVGRDATTVYERLLRRGVIVRPLGAWGLPTHLRASIRDSCPDSARDRCADGGLKPLGRASCGNPRGLAVDDLIDRLHVLLIEP